MSNDFSTRDLTQQVWDQVAAERALRPTSGACLSHYDPLLHDSERRYVNARYVLDRTPCDGDDIARERLAGVRPKLRRRAARFVVHVLGRYLDDEQEFLAHLVRLQNTITVRVDRTSEEVRQVEALLRAESDRLREANTVLHARLEDRIRALEADLAELRRLRDRSRE